MSTDNVTPMIDPLAALEAQADKELAEEFNKNDLAKIKQAKRRILDAKLIVQNLEIELETLMLNLRARRKTAD